MQARCIVAETTKRRGFLTLFNSRCASKSNYSFSAATQIPLHSWVDPKEDRASCEIHLSCERTLIFEVVGARGGVVKQCRTFGLRESLGNPFESVPEQAI